MATLDDLRQVAKRVSGLHERIVADVPALQHDKVWCRTCRREQAVNVASCLRGGWPKCCGYTMTIDPPVQP